MVFLFTTTLVQVQLIFYIMFLSVWKCTHLHACMWLKHAKLQHNDKQFTNDKKNTSLKTQLKKEKEAEYSQNMTTYSSSYETFLCEYKVS